MSRFHPRLRYLCLLVFTLVGSWLLLAAVFLFLPALPYDWDVEGPVDLIQAGYAVTRVYSVSYRYPYETRDLHRESFAIDYQLNSTLNAAKTWLVLNGETSLDLQAYYSHIDRTVQAPQEAPAYYVSEPIYITAKQGDFDGINPPWFRQADACLLFWEIHQDTALLPLRLKVFDYQVSGQLVQLWPDSIRWDKSDDPSLGAREPLIAIHSDDKFFRNITVRFPWDIEMEQSSPSRTFALRRAVQSILVPTGLFVYKHSGFVAVGLATVLYVIIMYVILLTAVYLLVVHVFWIINGRPAFGPWSQSYWLTRRALARLPVQHLDSYFADRTQDNESGSRRHPQPLRGVSDFFRSRSPLDDLFITFEFTKYMVEPIRFGRERAGSGHRAQVTGVPNDFRFNLSHRTSKVARAAQEDEQSNMEKGTLPA